MLAFSLIQISYPLNVNRSEGFNRKLRSVLARLVVLVILLWLVYWYKWGDNIGSDDEWVF